MKNIEILEKVIKDMDEVNIEYYHNCHTADEGFVASIELTSGCYYGSASFQDLEDIDPEDLINLNIWEMFGGWEQFLGEVHRDVLNKYVDKMRPYITEDEANDIENYCENWLDDYRDKLPEELYSEIENTIDEIYSDLQNEFSEFEKKFENKVWNAAREAIKAENEEKNEVIYAEYGRPDWADDKNYSYSDFLYMCAGDACAIPGLLFESIDNELRRFERVIDYTILENNGRKYFVKTDDDRVLCLNDLM